ncbi:MAG TPA: hypothetical protein VMU69_31670 [Bradyrhizobium sp.]|nr:hypothetical protein [Bradyrhizobium sp.]
MKTWLAITVVMLSAVCNARADQTAAPEPVLRVTLDPPRVVVGQKTTLQIDVLAPNYMTAPPELPGFQIHNAVTRPLQNVNLNEQREGTAYAGVRFEFEIYPQEPGSYAVADQKVRIRYAADPPSTREVEMLLPHIAFEAFIPDAAAGLHPFLAATGLTIEQEVQRSSEQLKTGDAITRTLIIKGEGVPAMLLPPQKFAAIEGLALYPAQPSLEDKTAARTDTLSSTRVDSATYMLQKPGDYSLPAIDVRWWNLGSGKIETVHLDAIAFQVAVNSAQPNAAVGAGSSRSILDILFDFVTDHWLLALLALTALAALMWISPRVARTLAARYHRRRQAYLQSETWSFQQFRGAVEHRGAEAAYFALLGWLQRFEPLAPDHSIEALKAAAGDATLDQELGTLERQLFAPDRGSPANWSGARLLRRVGAARRALQRQAARSETAHSLPQRLNPVSGRALPDGWRRLPAR